MDKVAAFTEILAQNPEDAFARYGLAMEYVQRGQLAMALDQFDELQRRHPDYTAGYQMAGQTLLASGKVPEAIHRIQEGVACAERTGNKHAMSEMQGMLEELQAQA
ncbi:MAG: tetratricopeptide repeat protein [Acidobacteriaceae bacterium]